ncbi:MAG: hypothetical protein M1835_004424 [Candelina submexicana]|nr:MAG: hypothetical protein M1835_004424 [Candelina submexicana]
MTDSNASTILPNAADAIARAQREIAVASDTSKVEIIEAIKSVEEQLKSVKQHLEKQDASMEKELLRIYNALSNLQTISQGRQAKLSWSIEGSVRGALQAVHGYTWGQPCTINSVRDVVAYISRISVGLPLDRNWIGRAETTILDELRRKECIHATLLLLQTVYKNSKKQSWQAIRKQMRDDPLLDDNGNTIFKNFAQAISNVPIYHINIFRQIENMAKRTSWADLQSNPSQETIADAFLRDEFLDSHFSLMCLGVYSNDHWVKSEDLPPHLLEYDCQGSIVGLDDVIEMYGAEIKSRYNELGAAAQQLIKRFELLLPVLRLLFQAPAISEHYSLPLVSRFECIGQACAPYVLGDKPPRRSTHYIQLTAGQVTILLHEFTNWYDWESKRSSGRDTGNSKES